MVTLGNVPTGRIVYFTKLKRRKIMLTQTIKNLFTPSEMDKSQETYVLNPDNHPDNHSENIEREEPTHEQILRLKEETLKQKEELLEVEVASLEHSKKARIKKEKARRKTLAEWIEIAKIGFSEKLEKHKAIFGISIALFLVSVFVHGLSFKVFLAIFFPTLSPELLLLIALLVALSLEGLATALYEGYHNNLAYSIYFVSLLTIISMGFYEYANGQSLLISGFRTVIGSLTLIGLFASHKAMRDKDFWDTRKTFSQLPKVYRVEINDLLEKALAEHKNGNTDFRLNFKDMLKTYNLRSPDFEKLLIRKGVRSKNYFQELPPRRRQKDKAKKQAKKTVSSQNAGEPNSNQ